MEASALPASVGLARPRLAFGASLLRIRSDDQLVSLFRAGNEDAFRVIHDRYRVRLHAYTRQMLSGSPHDCEDALQEVFVRAYFGLRTNRRDLALRPWLYRVAHNRCVDELRRPPLALVEPDENVAGDTLDPAEQVEQRDALRRLISDVQRLPDQQRSALLMRELSGMSYQDVAHALGVSVPAVKSLLVRARVGLAQATEARDTSCAQIREELILAHDRKVRPSGLARRHLSECADCRQFRTEMRGVSRQLAALVPTLGPIGVIANLLGFGGGGATVGSGTAVAGGAGAAASAGLFAGGHVVTLLAAAVVTAGGAVELQKTIIAPPAHHVRHHVARDADRASGMPTAPSSPAIAAAGATPAAVTPSTSTASPVMVAAAVVSAAHAAAPGGHATARLPISQLLDPDHLAFTQLRSGPQSSSTATTGVAVNGGTTTSGPSVSSPSPVPILPPAANGSPLPLSSTGVPSTGTDPTTGGGAPAGTGTGGSTTSGPTSATTGTTSSDSGAGTPAATTGSDSPSTGDAAAPGGTQALSGSSAVTSSGTPVAGTSGSVTRSSAGATPVVGTNVPVRTRTLGRSGSTVARTVAAGGATGVRVVTFLATRRHARSSRFTLGTLLAR